MAHLTVARANDIVDRIAEIAMGGEFNQPVALNRVGATSTAEALAALYVVTADLFKTWALNKENSHNQKVLREFIKGARGTGMWVATNFNTEGKFTGNLAVDPSVKDSETIESFVKFLMTLDPEASNYWDRVYSHIGINNPGSSVSQVPEESCDDSGRDVNHRAESAQHNKGNRKVPQMRKPPSIQNQRSPTRRRPDDNRKHVIRIALCSAGAVVLMLFAIAIVYSNWTSRARVDNILAQAKQLIELGKVYEAEELLKQARSIDDSSEMDEVDRVQSMLFQKKERINQVAASHEAKIKRQRQETDRRKEESKRIKREQAERNMLAKASTYKKTDQTTAPIYRVDGERDYRNIHMIPGFPGERVDLSYLNLPDASLSGANFRFSRVAETTFANADLSGADFYKSNLSKSNFTNANLSGATFEGATLPEACFRNANLTSARFTEVVPGPYGNAQGLGSADFSGAWYYAGSPPISPAKSRLSGRLVKKQRP